MYVRLYTKILDSSIASSRKLRHFFTDLLLCADPDGNILMTKAAIAKRIDASLEEVEWGLNVLLNPDPETHTTENQGRRIVALDGCGYGWKILNYEIYRDFKTAKELRDSTAERVRNYRERKKLEAAGMPVPESISVKPNTHPKRQRKAKPDTGAGLVTRGMDPDKAAEMVQREMEQNRAELEAKAAAAPVEQPTVEGVVV